MLSALQSSGLLDDMSHRGVRHLFYGQIDNPLLPVCDPRLLGAHAMAQSEMSTLAVRKRSPLEKVGNLVSIAGRSHIIEYSDIPESIVEERQKDGSLRLWAGNIAVHVFDLEFLQRVADDSQGLPFHRALKKVPCLDAVGNRSDPEQPNAMKFERFIFDLLPLANRTIAVEGDRDQCFAPVKNPIGSENDTPETSRRAMVELDRRLLQQCGAVIGKNADVEINPLWAIDAQALSTKVAPGARIEGPTWFSEEELHTGQQAARKAA
jgi:UDP-N-acetylglucosamine/UDP-N-acetylgalactosamine diphosphorylase